MNDTNEKEKNTMFKNRKFGVIFITSLIRPFMRIKLRNSSIVDEKDFPAVFICNHGELYGPLSAAVGLPFDFRPWINEPMLDKKKAYDFIFENTMEQNSLPDFLKVGISEIGRILGTWALNSYNPIPVRKDSLSGLKETLELSVDALIEGSNILIFPENPDSENDGRYNTEGLSAFSSGFAHLAKSYYKKSGKAVTFYPMYTDKQTRTIYFGDSVKYDPENPPALEKKRLVTLIESSMNLLKQSVL